MSCGKCGAKEGEAHGKVDGDCALPHRNHSRQLVDDGRVCIHCVESWDEWLTEVPELYADLSAVLYAGSITDDTAEHSRPKKAPGSPSPIRLHAWALWRNEVNDHITDEDGVDHATYLGGNLPDIAAVLGGWEQAVRVERQWTESDTAPTISGAAAFLRANINHVAALHDAEEFHTELRWCRRALHAAHGISDPQPLFPCLSLDCNGHVWPMSAGSPRCDHCGRPYGTLDCVRAKGEGLHERRRLQSVRVGAGGRA